MTAGCGGQPAGTPEAESTASDGPAGGFDVALPPGWQAAQDVPLPGHARKEGAQTAGSRFVGSEVFAAATYDPASPSRRYGCKGGGPILDAMPKQGAFVDLLQQRNHGAVRPSKLPPKPARFIYRDASRVLHECYGESFEFGPFEASGRAFVARIWMHSEKGSKSTRINATGRSTRKAALGILEGLKIGPKSVSDCGDVRSRFAFGVRSRGSCREALRVVHGFRCPTVHCASIDGFRCDIGKPMIREMSTIRCRSGDHLVRWHLRA